MSPEVLREIILKKFEKLNEPVASKLELLLLYSELDMDGKRSVLLLLKMILSRLRSPLLEAEVSWLLWGATKLAETAAAYIWIVAAIQSTSSDHMLANRAII